MEHALFPSTESGVVLRCTDCGAAFDEPRDRCPECGSPEIEKEEGLEMPETQRES
ncbi:hypothetical protein BRC94_12710 [Halobacteriales archaeon QS_5_70_17]|nr:MAG: hypothetical protein BRC94_12710 [Halobacteriales archaeon QS_5_70_17]